MRVAADRLSLRWYLGYDLGELLPDHSSLTNIRDRYGVAIFRRFFDQIVELANTPFAVHWSTNSFGGHMYPYVIPLDAVQQTEVAVVGAKAAVLGALLQVGFPVPPGVCLTTAAFQLALATQWQAVTALLQGNDLDDPQRAAQAAAAIEQCLTALVVPAPVMTALEAALAKVVPHDPWMAVRSSAVAEDLPEASFAGQYNTVVGVRGLPAIVAAVLTCWRSFFSAHALVARYRARALSTPGGMGVVIQRLVDAECAGVCFSVDPVQQRRDRIVINAAWGMGVGVVDGSVAVDTLWVRRDQLQLDAHRIVEQTEQIGLNPTGGTRRVAVPDGRRRAAVLPPAWAQHIAEFTVASETLFGQPQDVEWALLDNHVWILQSRPITTLPPALHHTPPFPVDWGTAADRKAFWRLRTPASHPLITPLEADVDALFVAAGQESALWAGRSHLVVRTAVNGHIYARVEPSPLSVGDQRMRQAAMQDLVARLEQAERSTWDYWGPEVITATERLRAVNLAAINDQALAEHLENALGALRRHWVIHMLLFVMPEPPTPFQAAFAAISGLPDDEAEAARAQLLAGEDTPLTTLIDNLYDLAQAARLEPAVSALVVTRPPHVLDRLATMPEAAPFRERLEAFLTTFGDHPGSAFFDVTTIRTPSWREQPEAVLQLLAPYLDPQVESPAHARARARAQRDALVQRLIVGADPNTGAAFRGTLAAARKVETMLEEHNYFIDQQSYGLVRAAVLAGARRLVADGVLGTADDVFWLHPGEITAALRADSPRPPLRGVVDERKAQAAVWATYEAPPILGTPAAQLEPRPPLGDDIAEPLIRERWPVRGQGASPGIRRGRARVVSGHVLLPDLAAGDILVAETARPIWSPLFPVLGGLVLDGGVLLDHAATTAREYGIPAVLGTGDGTQRIREGSWIRIDGTTGIVDLDEDSTSTPSKTSDAETMTTTET
jgi:pyruvate,water dikinase